ncbi:MAG: TonB-dependent receptor [Prevotellaceae bacterium]|nr:TonB-dependent receptor [Prevotellaceae bacterium]
MNWNLIFFLLIISVYPVRAAGNKSEEESHYPSESMVSRLNRIAMEFDIKIAFDGKSSGRITLPVLKKESSAETMLEHSLLNTAFKWKKTAEKTYSIVNRENTGHSKPAGTGSLSGTVFDEQREPIVGATITIAGTTQGVATDLDGKYTLQGIPAGTASVVFSFISYETKQVTDIKINTGRTTQLDVVLQEASLQLGEVVVTAKYREASSIGMFAVQKANVSMTDGISSDLIKKTSDNNVAQVLKRVVGVTINDGKFVTVRGMSERYNNMQLNGSSLPSTEPNRRNFSFDIIPASLIENVVVNKTFTPDLPGEFTGGLVQVKTLSVPNEKFLNISLGTGLNTISTGREFQTNKRFTSDYFFGEIDRRSWYAGHDDGQITQSQYNAGQINHYGFYKYKAVPLQNYSLSFGLPFKLNEQHSLGLIGALTYRHEETLDKIKDVNTFSRDSLVEGMSDHFNRGFKFITAVGAVANIGWETDNHSITWRNLYNNRFTHHTMNRMMNDYYDNGVVRYEVYSTPLQAHLMQTQLDGEHTLFNKRLKLSWSADYNKTSRVNPDDRYAQASVNLAGGEVPNPTDAYLFDWRWSLGPSQPYISTQFVMYNRLDETKDNAGANAEYTFRALKKEQKLKAGFHYSRRRADYDQQYLHGFIDTKLAGEFLTDVTSLQRFYDPVNFDRGMLYYKASGFSNRAADYYEGKQTIEAVYLMGEFNPFNPLRIIGGVRMEHAKTDALTRYSWYENGIFHIADTLFTRTELEWLPSVTAIYAISPKLNLRAAFTETLARPDFRELTEATYYNVEERLEVTNVKPLEKTSVKNYDVRLEWYPFPGEVVSFSAFYKDFDKPVEKMVRVKSDQQSFFLETVNLDQAALRGLELNFRKSFRFISQKLKDLWLGGNAAVLEGNIETENWKSKRERPLQGLAPYNINGSLAYEGTVWGAVLNYTRVGRTLAYGGEFEKYDQYENPRNVLDLQLSARLLKQKLEIKFNISDFLNEDIIVYRNHSFPGTEVDTDGSYFVDRTAQGMDYNNGDYVMSRIGKGVNMSISASYKF